ncbi:MAG TPA: hypothetical protein PLZ36_16400, partial [Armatimonadota bacterium]|nr:hypothetical protein [Armatimonadota bacterium]
MSVSNPGYPLLVPGETYCGAGRAAAVLGAVLGRFGARVAVARGGGSYPASLVRDAARAAGVTLVEL